MQPIPEDTLGFTPDNERKALRLIITDRKFALKWRGRIRADHFDNPWNGIIFNAVNMFMDQYQRLPVLADLEQVLKDGLTVDDPIEQIILHLRDALLDQNNADLEMVKDKILEHVAKKDWTQFLYDSATHVRDGTYMEIPALVSKMVGRHGTNPIVEPYRAQKISERVAAETVDGFALPSKWPTFNRLHGGGHINGTVTVYMGPSGSGKSIILCNEGANGMMLGKTVYHFTFELSKPKTEARYDVILTGCTYDQRKENPQVLDNTMKVLEKQGLGDLFVIERPTGTCTAAEINAAIEEQFMICGKEPDIVILDYLTIMAPNDSKTVDMTNDYSKLKRIAEETRAVAMARDIRVLSAVQSNRGSIEKVDGGIGKADIADSFAVIHVLDDVISINQSVQEKAQGKLRLFSAKSRDFADSYFIACSVNYGNLRIMESVEDTDRINNAIADQKDADHKAKLTQAEQPTDAPLPAPPKNSAEAMNAVLDMANAPKTATNQDGWQEGLREAVGASEPVPEPTILVGAAAGDAPPIPAPAAPPKPAPPPMTGQPPVTVG